METPILVNGSQNFGADNALGIIFGFMEVDHCSTGPRKLARFLCFFLPQACYSVHGVVFVESMFPQIDKREPYIAVKWPKIDINCSQHV